MKPWISKIRYRCSYRVIKCSSYYLQHIGDAWPKADPTTWSLGKRAALLISQGTEQQMDVSSAGYTRTKSRGYNLQIHHGAGTNVISFGPSLRVNHRTSNVHGLGLHGEFPKFYCSSWFQPRPVQPTPRLVLCKKYDWVPAKFRSLTAKLHRRFSLEAVEAKFLSRYPGKCTVNVESFESGSGERKKFHRIVKNRCFYSMINCNYSRLPKRNIQ